MFKITAHTGSATTVRIARNHDHAIRMIARLRMQLPLGSSTYFTTDKI